MEKRSSAGSWSPRVVVMGVLMASFAWALVIPASLTQPPSAIATSMLILGLCVFGASTVLALHTAVSPSATGSQRRVVLLVATTLALWWPLYSWAEPTERPWAWLAGFAAAASGLVSLRLGVVACIVLGSASVFGGVAFGSAWGNLLTLMGCAATVWLTCQGFVWLLRLLWTAQARRDAEAGLAVAQERLRSSRELHDVLGHRLGLIALKAELVADAVPADQTVAVREINGIRELATQTLAEARRTIHGETVSDLPTQIRNADLVLSSAGIEAGIEADAALLDSLVQWQSQLLATVLREGVTNILRHSDAGCVWIGLADAEATLGLTIINDGIRDPRGVRSDMSSGSGLASLSARCRALGARLQAGTDSDGHFRLTVEMRTDRVPT